MHLPIDIAAVRLFLRLLYALIFLSAGMSKLAHPHRFRQGIQDYSLLPVYLEVRLLASHILSFTIPVVELLVGLCLISGYEIFPAVLVATGLFAIFSGAIAINLSRGRYDLSCHCGGVVGEHTISWWLVTRNILFMAGLLIVLAMPSDMFTLDAFVHHPSGLQEAFVGVILPVLVLVCATVIFFMLLKAMRLLRHS